MQIWSFQTPDPIIQFQVGIFKCEPISPVKYVSMKSMVKNKSKREKTRIK